MPWKLPKGVKPKAFFHNCVAYVHSATCSGLSAGVTGSPQALAIEIDAMGVMDRAVEGGVGVGGRTVGLWRVQRGLVEQLPLQATEERDGSVVAVLPFDDFDVEMRTNFCERLRKILVLDIRCRRTAPSKMETCITRFKRELGCERTARIANGHLL